MLKIFKTYGNMIAVWFLFSAVNYKWPANGAYASWNLFTIDSDHFWKIFGIFSCFFIASCYGYLQKTKDEDIEEMNKLMLEAKVLDAKMEGRKEFVQKKSKELDIYTEQLDRMFKEKER